MTIYERLLADIKSASGPTCCISKNDLSNVLEALKKCDDMICDSCGYIGYPEALKNVYIRKIAADEDDDW